jgi:hypothetical protein
VKEAVRRCRVAREAKESRQESRQKKSFLLRAAPRRAPRVQAAAARQSRG